MKKITTILSVFGLFGIALGMITMMIGTSLLINFIPAIIIYLILVTILKYNIAFYQIYWITFLVVLLINFIKNITKNTKKEK